MTFMPGDLVRYVGNKFKDLKRGEVVSRVHNQPSALVVDFEGDTYVMTSHSLVPFIPKKDENEPEVVRTRRRTDSED